MWGARRAYMHTHYAQCICTVDWALTYLSGLITNSTWTGIDHPWRSAIRPVSFLDRSSLLGFAESDETRRTSKFTAVGLCSKETVRRKVHCHFLKFQMPINLIGNKMESLHIPRIEVTPYLSHRAGWPSKNVGELMVCIMHRASHSGKSCNNNDHNKSRRNIYYIKYGNIDISDGSGQHSSLASWWYIPPSNGQMIIRPIPPVDVLYVECHIIWMMIM
jgi:hypothetical protein